MVSDDDRRDCGGRLWAVTSYYNPVPYRRRLDNYRIFRDRLSLPLLTVELAYRAPELGAGDADILVQIPGRDVMWQKERLLNLAIAALPAHCDRVAWLDCDVVFEDASWVRRLEERLETCALVQPFSRVRYLTRDWVPGMAPDAVTEFRRTSVIAAIESGLPPVQCLARQLGDRRKTFATGFAWAGHRDLVERHGLYDAAIIGTGDRLVASASYGCADAAADLFMMSDRRRQHFKAWADPWAKALAGRVGALEGEVLNLWHGEMEHRGNAARHSALRDFDYDPSADIVLDDTGAWRWASDKPELHAYLRDYFRARREDG
jgi:hypothetical protein